MTVETRSAQRVGARGVEAQSRALDVGGPDAQALVLGQPSRGRGVVIRAHERVNVTIATIEQASQQFLPNEAGRAG